MKTALSLLKNKMFYLVVLLVSLTLVLPVAAYNGASARKNIIVGWYQAPGLQEGTDISSLKGFNYEYLGLMAQHANWQYKFVFADFDVLEQMLLQGKIDIIGDVAKTDERLEKYAYCEYPSCYSRLLMVCRWDDDRFAYDDYQSFNGIKVALSPSSFRRNMVNRRAARHNFSVEFLEYPTDKEMLQALDCGEADVAVFSDAMISGKYKIISKWEPTAQYFIINKNRPDILNDMNAAMDQIQSSDRFIQERLYEKYFNNTSELITAFSREELDYINSKPKIKVLMHVNDSPISYLEDGKPHGIAIDYLNNLAARTGLTIEYVYYDSYKKLQEGLTKGEGDIYVHMPDNFKIGRNFSASLTQPYTVVRDGFVTRIGNNADIKTVAIVEAHPLRRNKLQARNFSVKEYADAAACLDAVLDNAVDAAVVDSGSYSLIAYHAKYQQLLYQGDPTLEAGICFGISDKSPRALYSIIKKVTNDMTKPALDNIAIKNTMAKYQYSVRDHLQHGAIFIFVIIVLFIIMLAMYLTAKHQKKFNAELAAAKLQADKANESKSVFLASMSHDLRTPLNGIIGYTDLALQATELEQKQDYMEKVRMSSNLLLDMVNDTLELSRIESGKLVLKEEVIDGKKYWEEIVVAMLPMAKVKNVTLSTDFTKYPQEMIKVDRVQVKKVLINLLSNAIKYTPSGGTVTVVVTALTPPVKNCTRRLIVQDNGIGMSQEFMQRMFEPFAQEHRSETSNVSGTGLGLAIVKKIVDFMGGNITAESVMHKGTKFTVDLPIEFYDKACEEQGDKEKSVHNKQLQDILAGCRVLLCEDNKINAEIAQLQLKNKHILVDWAKDGQEGVDKFSNSAPGFYDFILMDLRMPRMDGLKATRTIRKLKREDAKIIPIIAMTADAFEESIQEAKQAGMNAYVTKPIVPTILFEAIFAQLQASKGS